MHVGTEEACSAVIDALALSTSAAGKYMCQCVSECGLCECDWEYACMFEFIAITIPSLSLPPVSPTEVGK